MNRYVALWTGLLVVLSAQAASAQNLPILLELKVNGHDIQGPYSQEGEFECLEFEFSATTTGYGQVKCTLGRGEEHSALLTKAMRLGWEIDAIFRFYDILPETGQQRNSRVVHLQTGTRIKKITTSKSKLPGPFGTTTEVSFSVSQIKHVSPPNDFTFPDRNVASTLSTAPTKR
jgi:hypothetical protein